LFDAYLAQDHTAADRLLADDLVFTSPQDDHIDKAAYFRRCFPTTGRLRSQHILHTVEAGGNGVFLRYEYELTTGERYRNAEFITVRDGRVIEIEVFFGGRLTGQSSPP
jgi:ketosteroid isomerase-like protein